MTVILNIKSMRLLISYLNFNEHVNDTVYIHKNIISVLLFNAIFSMT